MQNTLAFIFTGSDSGDGLSLIVSATLIICCILYFPIVGIIGYYSKNIGMSLFFSVLAFVPVLFLSFVISVLISNLFFE